MRSFVLPFTLLVGALTLSACAAFAGQVGPPPLEVPVPTLLPAAEVTLFVDTPDTTPANGVLQVEIFDEVAGFGAAASVTTMQGDGNGAWSGRLTPPAGSLLYYRFVRTSPARAVEADAQGREIRRRIGLVDGPTEIHEVIAAWVDSIEPIPTGRIVGTIFDALQGSPLPDILVSAGGLSAFTDGEGAFRLEGLPAGLHTLVAVSPSGAHLPIQQGAIVAGSSETPAALGLLPAAPATVTFQVTVPPDTPPGVPVRIAGNVLGLGNTFSELAGGTTGSVGRMPQLVMVDPTRYIGIVPLYAGTDLRYRYTLGDGVWNTERDASGGSLTRQVLLAEGEQTFVDTVSTWHGPTGEAVTFSVASAAAIPPTDQVSLQLSSTAWAEPIPMWPAGPATWTYSLFGPLDAGTALAYRYCRNQQCGIADDGETPGENPTGRQATPSGQPLAVNDTVTDWAWWQADQGGAVVVAPEIQPRAGYEVGYEVSPAYSPSWLSSAAPALRMMAETGANSVLLTPAWVLRHNGPLPSMAFETGNAPLLDELARQIDEAAALGLTVGLHPSLVYPDGTIEEWWADAPRDGPWWTVWFERYRSFVLTYAALAERTGAAKLVLGGPEVAPALPGGVLADGSPSGAPVDAEARWRSLIEETRGVYTGPVAFEIEFGRTLQLPPVFLDAVDHVHVYWHVPLGEGRSIPSADMQVAAYAALDGSLLAEPLLQGRPIFLSVEYLSVDGGATGCAQNADGTCRAPESFDAGADPDPDLAVDLEEQSQALNAVILAAYGREAVQGFYARRYYPPVALHDKSASVNGKPAGQMLGYWFTRIDEP